VEALYRFLKKSGGFFSKAVAGRTTRWRLNLQEKTGNSANLDCA
jgi:hypothetical protein